jgi:hypothetical protein
MKMRTLAGLAVLASMAFGAQAQAQTMMTGTISMIRTGWNDDAFAIVTVEPMANPNHCARADGYISQKPAPGYDTFLAAALTAYSVRRRVVLTVHNTECAGGWPKLIGINLTMD